MDSELVFSVGQTAITQDALPFKVCIQFRGVGPFLELGENALGGSGSPDFCVPLLLERTLFIFFLKASSSRVQEEKCR